MFWLLPPLLLVFSSPGNTASQDSSKPLRVNGVLGEAVTLSLKPPVPTGIQSTTWLHNGNSIAFILPKAVSDSNFFVTDPEWKDRLQPAENYSLRLSNLTGADAGRYCAQMTIQTSKEFSCYTLQVFRRLRNVQTASHTWLSETGTCEIHLTCFVENSKDTFIRWQVVGNTSVNEANLSISWDSRNSGEQEFTCIAENPVSNISLSVSTQRLCEGVLSTKNQPDAKWIVTVVVVVLMCTAITVGLLVWRKKDRLWRTAETIRNIDYVSVSPGNTVYAHVTHPNRQINSPTPVKSSDFSTIYSTVHQSKEPLHQRREFPHICLKTLSACLLTLQVSIYTCYPPRKTFRPLDLTLNPVMLPHLMCHLSYAIKYLFLFKVLYCTLSRKGTMMILSLYPEPLAHRKCSTDTF
ncbi:SLAM family member 6 isoform X3 [Mustela putorius furo]|uniref:SLAM family member 6 isoform X3 n=1 Tax=Mustela putorius furo TaxID=9669 RepID=A0A8U0NCE5_MUSPF|nr:SLAM family member 6 isoform X3 [Mustela putorius furo]